MMLQLHTVRTGITDTPKRRLNASSLHEYHSYYHIPPDTTQTSPKQPQDISRELKMSTNNNMRQQTPPDILKQHLTVSEGVFCCLFMSVGVCFRLLASWVSWRCLAVSDGCLGGVYGYLSGIHGNIWWWDMFGGYLGPPSLQYGTITLLWHTPERHNFFLIWPY